LDVRRGTFGRETVFSEQKIVRMGLQPRPHRFRVAFDAKNQP
jgi:hypothetical protein